MNPAAEPMFDPKDFSASLREVVATAGLDGAKLTVTLGGNKDGQLIPGDRHTVVVYDGKSSAEWPVPSLVELFRGTKAPPSTMHQYPPDYVPVFYLLEKHLLTASVAADLRDREVEEIYSMLRRRPDGKSLGLVHDFLWQVAALALAMRPMRQAEFEAVFGQLARSCRRWQMGSTSRNYIAYLKQSIGTRV